MDEAGEHVPVLNIVVVVGAVNVGGDNRGELASILLMVHPIHNVNHPLGHAVAIVGGMRRPVVDLRREGADVMISKWLTALKRKDVCESSIKIFSLKSKE